MHSIFSKDERKLNMEIDKIDVRQRKEWDKFQQQKTAFEHDQAAKRKSWRRSDELSLTRLNLPVIIPDNFNSSSSARSVKEVRAIYSLFNVSKSSI